MRFNTPHENTSATILKRGWVARRSDSIPLASPLLTRGTVERVKTFPPMHPGVATYSVSSEEKAGSNARRFMISAPEHRGSPSGASRANRRYGAKF
ncbi:hypothetical protein DPEC_G00316260 [Dallia pectoralis]|uniref:Uncharacterized protein n=1 Tax=Dallia pectoralis TaxID=75939 RepID=A0ACC2FCH3_DALPE|nr:hypothetical protein DPEC_G00316260 [Dallia pectoralis]